MELLYNCWRATQGATYAQHYPYAQDARTRHSPVDREKKNFFNEKIVCELDHADVNFSKITLQLYKSSGLLHFAAQRAFCSLYTRDRARRIYLQRKGTFLAEYICVCIGVLPYTYANTYKSATLAIYVIVESRWISKREQLRVNGVLRARSREEIYLVDLQCTSTAVTSYSQTHMNIHRNHPSARKGNEQQEESSSLTREIFDSERCDRTTNATREKRVPLLREHAPFVAVIYYASSSNTTRKNGSRTHRPAAAQRAAESRDTPTYMVLCTCALLTSRSICRIYCQ
ncbi:unnamed protein product, partial [Trichogramma brassicae]